MTRTTLVLVVVWVWALRLAGYVTWRNWGEPEDERYVGMRERNGDSWTVRSLFTVFWLQGALAWLISIPLLAALTDPAPEGLVLLDIVGIAVWVVGLVFEAGGDWQLSRFLANPDNRGKVMDQGLWRYSRHPNYFGDVTVWVGFGLIGLATGAWWGLAGPFLMYWFTNISAKMTEKNMSVSRSARATTSTWNGRLLPGPPGRG